MLKINVPDMRCEHCVSRISKGFTEAAIDFTISLTEKTVTLVNNSDKDNALNILDDLGFTPEVSE